MLKGIAVGLVLLLFLWVTSAWTAPPQGGFVLVVNVDNVLTSISRKDAERIFLIKKRGWSDGEKIAVVINRNQDVFHSFCFAVLKRSPRQFMIFQKKMLFRGQAMLPPMVKTDKEVVDFVASHRGGIGYVTPGTIGPGVKILQIEQ